MMTRKPVAAFLLFYLLFFSILSAVSVRWGEAEPAERKAGVKVGDMVKYGEFQALWDSENPATQRPQSLRDIDNTLWITRTVQDVSGTTVVFVANTRFRNGTEKSGELAQIDVATGEGSGNLSFVSALLGVGDSVYTTGDLALGRFNATLSRTYAGITRATNLYNVTNYSYEDATVVWTEMFWDKATGVLVEQFLSYSKYDASNYLVTGSLEYKMIDNNIWIGVPDDVSPVADSRGPRYTVETGDTVYFDASGSSDDVGIASFNWDFGDGSSGDGMQASHVYTKAGVYNVTLTVADAKGNSAKDFLSVTVKEGPPPSRLTEVAVGIVFVLALLLVAYYFFRRR